MKEIEGLAEVERQIRIATDALMQAMSILGAHQRNDAAAQRRIVKELDARMTALEHRQGDAVIRKSTAFDPT